MSLLTSENVISYINKEIYNILQKDLERSFEDSIKSFATTKDLDNQVNNLKYFYPKKGYQPIPPEPSLLFLKNIPTIIKPFPPIINLS